MDWVIRAIGAYLLIIALIRAAIALFGGIRPERPGWLWTMTVLYGLAGLGCLIRPLETTYILLPVLIIFAVVDEFIRRQRDLVRQRVRLTETLISLYEGSGNHIEAARQRNDLEMFKKSRSYRLWAGKITAQSHTDQASNQ